MFGRHPAILSASGSSASFMRPLQPAAWFRADTGVTVTGQGVSTLADQSGNGRDLLQSTDASRPPYLSYTGTKYLYLPGVAGNGASSPAIAAYVPTTTVSLRARVKLNDWTPTASMALCGQYSGGVPVQDGPFMYVNATVGYLGYICSNAATGVISANSSVAPTVSDGATIWVRADHDDSAGTVKFYTAPDSPSAPEAGDWTQLGTTRSVTAAGGFNASPTQLFRVGACGTGAPTFPLNGIVYRAISILDGTTVVDFNPDRDASDGSTSFASSATGETWTVNKGSSGLIAYLVGKPWLMGDGSADILATSGFTLNQPLTRYIVGRSLTWTLNDYIADGNAKDSAAFIQSATTPRFKISAGSAIGENAGLALNTTGVMCCVINGASSLTQVNLGTPVTGDAGAANAGGLTLFGSGTVATGFWNGMVAEDITFPTAHDATQRARVIQYLAGRHGIAL